MTIYVTENKSENISRKKILFVIIKIDCATFTSAEELHFYYIVGT